MMKHNKLLFILVLIIIFNHIFAQDVIRSASEYDYPPLALVKDGQADGFSVELLRAALDAVERDVSFYVGPWSEIKTDLAEGKIDVLPLVGRTPEREPLYDFTVPYLTLYGAIFVKEGNTSIRSVEDLKSKTIVVMKGDNAEEYIRREQLSKHIITTTTFEEAFRLVSEGKYDAVITQKRIGMQLLKKAGIENVIPITVIKEFKQDFTFAVTEGDSELLTLLNDGLSRIIINGTFDTIYDKWLDSIALEESKKVNLTAKEKAFLKAHPVITLGGGSTFEPYIMHDDDNNVIGYDADILKLIEINTGLKIRFELGKWSEIQERAKKRELDGFTTASLTKERAKYFNHSEPYSQHTPLIFVKKGNPAGIHSIDDISGKKVAIQKGNAFKEILIKENKKVEFIYYDTMPEVIKAVVSRKADCTIFEETLFYIARKLMLAGMIETSFTVGETSGLHFQLRNDWPELVSIINKGLKSIPESKKSEIHNKWLSAYENKTKITFAKESIQQKAEDVAKQIEIYLKLNPDMTLKELQEDSYFRNIAIQRVGKTGYTAILSYETLFNLFHIKPEFQGMDLSTLKETLPDMWDILLQTIKGYDSGGLYNWIEPDGTTKKKYMYTSIVKLRTADDVVMVVAATTYLDEYKTIETEIKEQEGSSRVIVYWVFGILVLALIVLLILNKLNIIVLKNNTLLLLLGFSLFLIVGIFVLNAYNITKKLEIDAIDKYFATLEVAANSKHKNIEHHVNHSRSSFQFISTLKKLSNEDLRKMVDLEDDLFEIFIMDSNGKITHSSNEANIGLSRATDQYFLNATKEGFIKPIYLSDTVEKVSYTFSYPYKEGVIVARMDLDYIKEIAYISEGLGESGECLLAYRDANSDAVFFTERRFSTEVESRDIIPKEDVKIPVTQALLGNEQEFSNNVDYRGVPVFAVTRHIDDLDIGLVVKIDRDEVKKSISGNTTQIWFSTSGIILALIVIGIAFYFLLTNALRKEIKNKTGELQNASKNLSEKIIQIQQSEELLMKIAENYPNSYLSIIEKDRTIGFTSGSEFKKNNLNPKDFEGLTIKQIFGEQLDNVKEYLDETFAGEEQSFELFINDQYQQYYTVPLISNNGSIDRILSVAENITNRKNNEVKMKNLLKKSEEQRLATLSVLSDLNAASRILKAEVSERMKAEEKLKKRMSELEIFNEVTVGRELKINDIRKEVNDLLEKTGRKKKYEVVE